MLRALMKKELLALLRDVHGLGALFLMPTVFIVIMSLALKDVYNPPVRQYAYAIVMNDDGAAAADFVARWQARRGTAQDATGWEQRLASARLRYVVVVERGFSQALSLPRAPDDVKLRLIAEPGLDPGLFRSTGAELAALVGELRANALLDRFLGMAPAGAASIDRFVAAQRLSTGIQPTAVQYNVPAWLIFGMFFVVAAISNLFVQERDTGVLARLATLGVPASVQIAAKALPYLAVNAVQAAAMLAVGAWLMPLIGGEGLHLAGIDWGALATVVMAVSCAAIALALCVASVVRTHAQSSAVGPIINVIMAAIGGIMVPTFVMPLFMQKVAALSPMHWGLEALLGVLVRGAGLSGIATPVGKLLAFALVMFIVASVLARRRLRA
ncbi:MAG: ABC transporter permease [Rhodocyclaceae bacterium]